MYIRQLTFAAVKNPKFHELFMTMVPTYTFIDRATGYFNRAMEFKKDYAALISYMWDFDNGIDQYLTDPEADKYMRLKEFGIDINDYNTEEERLEKQAYLDKILGSVNQLPHEVRKRFLSDGDIVG